MSATHPGECPSCGLMAIPKDDPAPDAIYHCTACDDWAWWDVRIMDWSPAPTRALAEEHMESLRLSRTGTESRGGGDIPPPAPDTH